MNGANLVNIKIIVGLGNPGKDYAKTRHNAGFLAVDYLIQKNRKNAMAGKNKNFEYFKIGALILIKPLTFMNESDKAVKDGLKYFKAKPEEILIIRDDSDIFFGDYKLKFNSASGGHKGIESIISSLKTKEFWQLKIGIRPFKEFRRQKSEKFVLKNFTKEEFQKLEKIFEEISIKYFNLF